MTIMICPHHIWIPLFVIALGVTTVLFIDDVLFLQQYPTWDEAYDAEKADSSLGDLGYRHVVAESGMIGKPMIGGIIGFFFFIGLNERYHWFGLKECDRK